jgi:hypothetical protein
VELFLKGQIIGGKPKIKDVLKFDFNYSINSIKNVFKG